MSRHLSLPKPLAKPLPKPRKGFRNPGRFLALALPMVALASSGCFIVNENDDKGDIAFFWNFDGETSCDAAGVSDVLVTVRQGATIRFEDLLECSGGGLTVRDFDPGDYEVLLDAYTSSDERIFSGDATVTVAANTVNDIGEIFLSPVQVEVVTGEVQFAWTFQYPNDDSSETDCARAGVDEVEVLLTPAAGNTTGTTFSQSYSCTDDGVRIEDLPEGDYDLVLRGFGTYESNDIDLFASSTLRVVILENDPDLVGDINLLRTDENFSDIDVNWVLPNGETCVTLGITSISFSMTRAGSGVVDDAFDVNCDASQTEVRTNFVPGAYSIEATALGTGNSVFLGSVTTGVAPGATQQVDVALVAE